MAVIALTASCGGGDENAGTPPFGRASGSGGLDGRHGGPAAADLIVTLSTAQLPNTGSATADISVTAIDASRNAIAGVPVTISADGNAVITVSGTETGPTEPSRRGLDGLGPRQSRDHRHRDLRVDLADGVTSRSSATTITSVLVPAVIAPRQRVRSSITSSTRPATPMIGQAVQIVAPSLTPAELTGTTGPNGDFVFNYTSPAATGSLPDHREHRWQVRHPDASGADDQHGSRRAGRTIAVGVGLGQPERRRGEPAGSESNRSEIRVLFLGANNLPVPNVRVKFDLNGDLNSIGGKFTTGNTSLYSDANGVVTTAYVPGIALEPDRRRDDSRLLRQERHRRQPSHLRRRRDREL